MAYINIEMISGIAFLILNNVDVLDYKKKTYLEGLPAIEKIPSNQIDIDHQSKKVCDNNTN